jgi:hypothetical protein
MRRYSAVIVERHLKTPMLLTDPLYPADQRIFRLLSRLKGSQRDMRPVAYDPLTLVQPVIQPVAGRELLLLFHQPLLQVSTWINH